MENISIANQFQVEFGFNVTPFQDILPLKHFLYVTTR